jgi:hypothetical protein
VKGSSETLLGVVGKAYPLSVAATSFAGYSLQQWVYITAIAVAACQLVSWGWRFYLWLHRPKD